MKAMILAAGRGERMRPLTDTTPKPLLKVGSRSLIEYHIEALHRAGVNQIVINHSWLGEQLPGKLGDGKNYGVEIRYSPEPGKPLETAGGIVKALPLLGDEPFIVVNGDIWTDFDFRDLPRYPAALAHLVLVNNPVHNPQGDFGLGENNILNNEAAYTYSGISVFTPAFFTDLEPGISALAPLLRHAIEQGKVSGQLYHGQWWDVGTPQRLAELDQFIKQRGT